MTSMVMVTVSLPPVFVAVIVYDADEVISDGVPEIAPVEESMERPVGSDGDAAHDVTVPPLEVGVEVVIATPFVKVYDVGLYAMEGAMSLTMMVTLAVSLPHVFVAVIV